MVDEQGRAYPNDKRAAFAEYLDLPRHVPAPMELALMLGGPEMAEETDRLQRLGWRVKDAHHVARSPGDFRGYVQQSLGEFSCAKPSYVRMRTGWISDRTVCYLASGRPAVVEYTGEIRGVPAGPGLLRYSSPQEAEAALLDVIERYRYHSDHARRIAETTFSTDKVIPRVLNSL
jgi:hypothetical protein